MFQTSTLVMDILGNLVSFIAPLWIALIFGVVVGWAWKPKWAIDPNTSNFFNFFKSLIPWITESELQNESATSSTTQSEKELNSIVNENDLQTLCKLVEEKDGGPPWNAMMDRSTPNFRYQAWMRDMENGLPIYRYSTTFENATPELVRDFFWDDEFRLKWDEMHIQGTTIQQCDVTGTMIVHWVRKFPLFCSDREYIIGRRIWNADGTYYCVTKAVPCSSIPRRSKPRRVDVYYSSFCVRAVKSRKDDQLTSCEVLLFHTEDMGIPWELAKLGIRKGMWGVVKKCDPGLRMYQKERNSGAPLSPCGNAAKINTKVSADYVRTLVDSTSNLLETQNEDSSDKPGGRIIPKALVVGGAIVLACTLDQRLLTKAVIFGIARRFVKLGRRV